MSDKGRTVSGNSLSRLSDLLDKAGVRLKEPDKPVKQRPPQPPKPRELSDEELFAQAMSGIERVSWRHAPLSSPSPGRKPEPESDAEDRRLMQEIMDGRSPITISNHPEYIEGWIGVAGKKLLPRLRDGLYSIQGQIDLHGLDKAEAEAAVEAYIIEMSRYQSCCVKIIHGRGINSPAAKATLKESLQRLLSTRKMSRYVSAYASAPHCDGGVGAVYVLLSRHANGRS